MSRSTRSLHCEQVRKKLLEEPKIRQGMEEQSWLVWPKAASVSSDVAWFYVVAILHRAVFPTFHTGQPCGT